MKKLTMAVALLLCLGAPVCASAAGTLLVLQVGMEGPQFSLATPEGKPKKSSELLGDRLTVLVFWSSWIQKSEAVLARMQKLYAQYRQFGFAVVGINVDEPKPTPQTLNKIKDTRERLKLEFPMLADPGLVTFRDYGIIAMPTTVVLDKSRVIRHELSGYPLTGVEALSDFVSATMSGNKPRLAAEKPHYQPNKSALSLFNMGQTALKSKSLAPQAEAWFKKAAQADPDFILPHLSLGRIYSVSGKGALAQAEYQAVLAREPQHPVALCELALLLVEQGDPAQGLALLERARKSDTPYAPCFYYKGYALGRQGRGAEAAQAFQEAERLDPSDYRTLVYQGKLFEQQKELDKAAASYGRALERIIHAH